MNRRDFLGGLFTGLFTGLLGIGGQWWLIKRGEEHHELAFTLDTESENGEISHYGSVTNAGNVTEYDVKVRITFLSDGPIRTYMTNYTSRPTLLGDQMVVDSTDNMPDDNWSYSTMDIPRMTPGDYVRFRYVTTRPVTGGAIDGQSNAVSKELRFEGTPAITEPT